MNYIEEFFVLYVWDIYESKYTVKASMAHSSA
jgi:hypothetical protein